jgi:nucleoside-diphosphate-sugar epimerase
VWSHPEFEFIHGDIRDDVIVRSALKGAAGVVHLAAIVGDPACSRNPDIARDVNLDGSRKLFVLAREAKVRKFLFASTCSNYGRMRDPSALVDETSELQPVSLYAETKVGVEQELLASAPEGSPSVTVLRFATIFGVSPRMRFDLTVNEFTMEMLTKRHLVVFGEQFWRPYVHVRDAARAIATVIALSDDRARGKVYNVGATDQNYTKAHLVDLIKPLVPEAVVEFVHREEDPRDYKVSFSTIQKELGYSITRTVPDGIAEVASLVRSSIITDFSDKQYRN